MIETKLDKIEVSGLIPELMGDLAVIVDMLHNDVGIPKEEPDRAYAKGLAPNSKEDKRGAKHRKELLAELIAQTFREAWDDEEDDGEKPEEPKESRPCCSECGEPIESLYSYYIDGAYLCEECMEDRYMVNTPVER